MKRTLQLATLSIAMIAATVIPNYAQAEPERSGPKYSQAEVTAMLGEQLTTLTADFNEILRKQIRRDNRELADAQAALVRCRARHD